MVDREQAEIKWMVVFTCLWNCRGSGLHSVFGVSQLEWSFEIQLVNDCVLKQAGGNSPNKLDVDDLAG